MSHVAVVTGANKGIGFAIVRNLCTNFNGIVYLTARDEGRGKSAVCELEKEGLNPKFHQLDISDPASINRFADYIKNTYGRLDVLVNNAGVVHPKDPMLFDKDSFLGEDAEDGDYDMAWFPEAVEYTLEINFWSTLRVCDALFPLLKPHARVVHVSSGGGKSFFQQSNESSKNKIRSCKTIDDVRALMAEYVKCAKDGTSTEQGWRLRPYGISKVALCAITPMQQELLDKDSREDIVVNSACPGFVPTDLTRHHGKRTIDQGAETPCYLALLPPACGPETKGKFFSNMTAVDWMPI